MTFDENGYPTEGTLKAVENWYFSERLANLDELLKLVYDNWQYREYWQYDRQTGCLSISTVGWSGNEYLMSAMQRNLIFWGCFWFLSRRGGHYQFKLFCYDETGNQRIKPELGWLE